MNIQQLHYVREVLGVRTVVKPKAYRPVYRLCLPVRPQSDFLFFCDSLDKGGEKPLLSNIAKALNSAEEQIIEIAQPDSPFLPGLFASLIPRFLPSRGVVVFGSLLAKVLMPTLDGAKNRGDFLVSVGGLRPDLKVPVCVVNSLGDLTIPDPIKKRESKQNTWQILKAGFPPP